MTDTPAQTPKDAPLPPQAAQPATPEPAPGKSEALTNGQRAYDAFRATCDGIATPQPWKYVEPDERQMWEQAAARALTLPPVDPAPGAPDARSPGQVGYEEYSQGWKGTWATLYGDVKGQWERAAAAILAIRDPEVAKLRDDLEGMNGLAKHWHGCADALQATIARLEQNEHVRKGAFDRAVTESGELRLTIANLRERLALAEGRFQGAEVVVKTLEKENAKLQKQLDFEREIGIRIADAVNTARHETRTVKQERDSTFIAMREAREERDAAVKRAEVAEASALAFYEMLEPRMTDYHNALLEFDDAMTDDAKAMIARLTAQRTSEVKAKFAKLGITLPEEPKL